ncbi:methyltransferase domain-containing protein [Saccharomonospora sp. NPDC046836]|uniref:class I SAM-dependent methyltransferase n=1 Tax=Saccharomonospora sp. NPDC046836 TaxID=3156921 RepID=UPI00340AFF13
MLEGYAGFVLPLLRPGMRVLDVGCGRGAITLSLGTATHPIHVLGMDADPASVAFARKAADRAHVSTVDFVVAEPYRIPLPPSTVDVVYSHALLEQLADPLLALAEFARVLRSGGLLALSTSDWSRAKLRPRTANVDAALRGLYLLQRRAGGDPFAGRHVAGWAERAGFRDVRTRARHHPGVGYGELAEQVETNLAAAIGVQHDLQLASAARSAWMWVRDGKGEFSQCWTELLATR